MMWCEELKTNVVFCSGRCKICDKRKVEKMGNYECIEEFVLPFMTNTDSCIKEYGVVAISSIWEKSDDISERDIRLNNISGNSDFPWIDISFERFKECFKPTN